MKFWLKLVGSSKKPLTHPEYGGRWEEEYIGFRKKRKPSIRAGDYMFFYAPGGTKKIFALSQAISNPEINPNYDPLEEGSCYWIIKLKYLSNLPVIYGIQIEEITTNNRNLSKSIQRQSHILLLEEESKLAYEKLMNKHRELKNTKIL